MKKLENILSILPKSVASEIVLICESRRSDFCGVSEIRLRKCGKSSIVLRGERIRISYLPSAEDMKKTLSLICEGGMYLYRDSLKDGYITLSEGVRVGICGHARYEGGNFVGLSKVNSFVFRIPTALSESADSLLEAFSNARKGMLIYSPPGVGKTTALRSLALKIGSGKDARQVSVIDERCEFCEDDYAFSSVDIFRGYRRADGIEIALRVMSPEVIVVDEIGRISEAKAMLESLNSGVRIIATAHADSFSELKKRISLVPFFENEIFDVFVGISIKDGKRIMRIER